ncbi:MAG: isochorismatase [Planctomycetota bacterium]|nr:MAG: isochorismatase [Planctomycetota bacterium]
MRVTEPFAPRERRFAEVLELAGYRLKLYTVRYADRELSNAALDYALSAAGALLPQPAATDTRPGLGFAIHHAGRGMDFFVLAWWDEENELCIRVLARAQNDVREWREVRYHAVGCVWDVEIIAFERDAYVATVLARAGEPDLAAYLRMRLG